MLKALLSLCLLGNITLSWGQEEPLKFEGLWELDLISRIDKNSQTELDLSTAQFGINYKFSPQLQGQVTFLYEELQNATIQIDQAFLLQNWEHFYIMAGKNVLPFGNFSTHALTDPLTLQMAEQNDVTLQWGFAHKVFNLSLFFSNGDKDKIGQGRFDKIWGANLGLDFQLEKTSLLFEVSYINNLFNSDTLTALYSNNITKIGAINLFLEFHWSKSGFILEYLRAIKQDTPSGLDWNTTKGAQFSALNIEMFHTIPLFSYMVELGYGHQLTNEALALDLPSSKAMMYVSTEFAPKNTIGLEYDRISQYKTSETSKSKTGSGSKTHEILLRWSGSF